MSAGRVSGRDGVQAGRAHLENPIRVHDLAQYHVPVDGKLLAMRRLQRGELQKTELMERVSGCTQNAGRRRSRWLVQSS